MPKITLKVIKGFIKNDFKIIADVKYVLFPIWDAKRTFSSLVLNCSINNDNLSEGVLVENL